MEPVIIIPSENRTLPKFEPVCPTCGHPLEQQDNFCKSCGALQYKSIENENRVYEFNAHFNFLAVYYVVMLIGCLAAGYFDFFNNYRVIFWLEVGLALWTLLFAVTKWHSILPLYSFSNVRLKVLVPLCLGAVLVSLAVNFVVSHLNLLLFETDSEYFSLYADLPYRRLLFIYSLAVYPAIFEELGFRAYLYNGINSFTSAENSIIISSLAFAIIHASIISLFWLIPFALLLGYLRYRYNTIWYGIFIHFIFNLTIALKELYAYDLLKLNQSV